MGFSSRGTVLLIKVKEGKLEFQTLLRKQLFTCSTVFTIFFIASLRNFNPEKTKTNKKRNFGYLLQVCVFILFANVDLNSAPFLSFDKK